MFIDSLAQEDLFLTNLINFITFSFAHAQNIQVFYHKFSQAFDFELFEKTMDESLSPMYSTYFKLYFSTDHLKTEMASKVSMNLRDLEWFAAQALFVSGHSMHLVLYKLL